MLLKKFFLRLPFLPQSHSLASSVLSVCWWVQRREETFLQSTEKTDPWPVPGHAHCSRWCPVKWDWRPLALRWQQKGIVQMCGCRSGEDALWDGLRVVWSRVSCGKDVSRLFLVVDFEGFSCWALSSLLDVWNAVFWRLITFPQKSTHSWVRQKACAWNGAALFFRSLL